MAIIIIIYNKPQSVSIPTFQNMISAYRKTYTKLNIFFRLFFHSIAVVHRVKTAEIFPNGVEDRSVFWFVCGKTPAGQLPDVKFARCVSKTFLPLADHRGNSMRQVDK